LFENLIIPIPLLVTAVAEVVMVASYFVHTPLVEFNVAAVV
jgi:hypothetical protein